MSDEVSEAVEELRRQREALESQRDLFFTRIAGPIERLSVLAGRTKDETRELIEAIRTEKVPDASGSKTGELNSDSDPLPEIKSERPGPAR